MVIWHLFRIFFISGLLTFSGGIAMIPMLHTELVTKSNYLTEEEFYYYTAISQTLPGVISLTLACFVGKKIKGWRGLIACALAVILPAYSIMLIITILYHSLPQNGAIDGVFTAVRATAGVFVLEASLNMGRITAKTTRKVMVVIGVVFAVYVLNISVLTIIGLTFIYAILLSAYDYFWRGGGRA